jgi:soluble lytic murein transglycosylase-like protein/predicted negative regulator of RcsB-dependent stress response
VYFSKKIFAAILGLLLASLAAQTAFSQSLTDRSEKIRTAIDGGNLNAAIEELRSLRTADAAAFGVNNFDYLLARLLDQSGDRAGAVASYQTVATRRSLLSQYALWHLAQTARATGDLVLERERLRQMIVTAPASLLREAATLRMAQSFFESADYNAAIATLRFLIASKNAAVARQALALSGEAYRRAGKTTEARDIFSQLLMHLPDASRPDDFALAGARGLDVLDKAEATRTSSESDHLQRASVYQFNRDFDAARAHHLAIVENYPQSAVVPESLYQIGRGFYQQDNYAESLKYLQRVTGQFSTSSSARDALALIAGAYSRQKRTNEAVAAYQEFNERFPAAPNPERAYLNIIDVLRDAGRDQEALSWVQQTRARFKDQIGGTLALFAQAKIHIAQDSWNAALSDLETLRSVSDLGGTRIPGGTTPSEIAFLRALALEQLGRSNEAIDAYLAIPEGRNEYYGYRANERLRAMNGDPKVHALLAAKEQALAQEAKHQIENGGIEAARLAGQSALRLSTETEERKDLLDLVRRAYQESNAYHFPTFQISPPVRTQVVDATKKDEPGPTHQALAGELLILNLYDEAAPELAAARLESNGTTISAPKNLDGEFTMAVYSLRGDLPYPAVRFAEQVWRTVPGDYLIELAPRQMIELLYPAPYRRSLLRYPAEKQVDPRFVLAIARQETRFQADAKSVAAARGLMQFIAATANDMARQLGRRDFPQDDLYNPDTAIEFGSQYLSSLFQRFPNQPPAVAASYNGGAENVARWIARAHSGDPNRYVPEIGFSQSKDYVFRVMSNYWIYQQLYSDQLQRQ